MSHRLKSSRRFSHVAQQGQAYSEYGLILFLIGITVIGAFMLLSQQAFALWHQISAAMPR
ncbi:MAG TPA: hypothetical protein VIT43_08335 [Candidatus Dormibacteraeota bacterium]